MSVATVTGGQAPIPVAECVAREGDRTVTWFGYRYDGADPVRVERGAGNSISPEGQPPTLFGPGVHVRVVAVATDDGVASWVLGTTTAASGPSTPDCDTITEITATPDTTQPGATDVPATSDPTVSTEVPASTDPTVSTEVPASTDPTVSTEVPVSTDPTGPGVCAPGERDVDGVCVPVAPVELVLVDNYLECDGHGVARFAAFNTNGFALGGSGFSSALSPQRLTHLAPQVIGDEVIASDSGRDLAEFVDVRYVTAVSWTVVHDGIEATVSAGVAGARANPACPSARAESTGVHGGSPMPTTMAITGSDGSGRLGVVAMLLVLVGAELVVGGRRPIDSEGSR